MGQEFRYLSADKLIETAENLAKGVGHKFPGSGLGKIADAITVVTREAAARAEKIRQPNWYLRIGLLALALLTVAGAVVVALTLPGKESGWVRLADFLVRAQGAAVVLSALVAFFWTLETRFQRSKAIGAIHELRALAHIIDMHQLAKDPARESKSDDTVQDLNQMRQYLHFSTELLAVVTKLGQLYVQDSPDGPTLAAVDQLENLGTGLTQKIWQKLMILEQIKAEEEEEDATKAS